VVAGGEGPHSGGARNWLVASLARSLSRHCPCLSLSLIRIFPVYSPRVARADKHRPRLVAVGSVSTFVASIGEQVGARREAYPASSSPLALLVAQRASCSLWWGSAIVRGVNMAVLLLLVTNSGTRWRRIDITCHDDGLS
jgi:hypothetical protein